MADKEKVEAREKVEAKRKEIVQSILSFIEQNPQNWQAGWFKVSAVPQNGLTNSKYRGINALYLWLVAQQKGYTDNRWVTFNQAKQLGASVKGNEKASPILYYALYDKNTKKEYTRKTTAEMTDEERQKYESEFVKPVLRYSVVFNAEQCVHFPEKAAAPEMTNEERQQHNNAIIERIIANSEAPVRFDGGNNAYYRIDTDDIHLPEIKQFHSMQDYYATALHEIAHSTGHPSRLNRKFGATMMDADYAIEELRAEMAAVFMQMENGIELEGKHIQNHSAYLASWLNEVKNDPKVFTSAISDAMKISDYVSEHYVRAATADEVKDNVATVDDTKENATVADIQQEAVVFNRELPFAAQVDAVLNGDLTENSDLLISTQTPFALRMVGLENRYMLMHRRHVVAANQPKNEQLHTHGLTAEQIKKLPDILANPTMIFENAGTKYPDRIVVVSNSLDNDGCPIIAAVQPEGDGRLNGERVKPCNFVVTMFGKDHFDNFLQAAIDENRVLFWDKEKTQTLYRELSHQLPQGLYKVESDIIIRKAGAFVNTETQNSSKKDETVSRALPNDVEQKLVEQQQTSTVSKQPTEQVAATVSQVDENAQKKNPSMQDTSSTSSKWQRVTIPAECIGKEYGWRTMVSIPKTSGYVGFAMFVPTKMLQKQADGSYQLLYDNTKKDFLKATNDGREVVFDGETLDKVMRGEKVLYQAKRVRAGKEAQKMVEQTLANIPSEMQEMERWCVHQKYFDKNAKGERVVKKRIFDVNRIDEPEDNYAKCNDSSTWASIDRATSAIKNSKKSLTGLTFVVGEGISVIDLDHCFDSAGKPSALAADLMSAFEGTTYMEKSMSGTGLHIFVKGDLRNGGKFGKVNKDVFGDIEVYDESKFMSVTGNIIGDVRTLGTVTAAQQAAVQKYLKAEEIAQKKSATTQKRSYTGFVSDDDVIAKIRASKRGSEFDSLYAGHKEGQDWSREDYALINTIAFFTPNQDRNQIQRIFEHSGLYRPQKGEKYLNRTIDVVLSRLKNPTNIWNNQSAATSAKPKTGGTK